MTREEKINTLKAVIQECEEYQWQRRETLFEIIKNLEQQPCEDAISRADAVRVASGYCHPANIAKELAKLPPTQPKIKTGHWIDMGCYHLYNDEDVETILLQCSNCKEVIEWNIESPHKPYYCENCGKRMVDPQESEKQNDY